MKLKKNHLIQKKNVLNEIRANNMSLQELRFFSIYLSKINVKDITTRVVRFPMDDFKAIMDLGRIDIGYMKNVTNNLLCKVVNVPDERGGYTGFQLFKECVVTKDDSGEWYVEIDAHDKALPLMFEFKNKYFSYTLWNALRLKSSNQLRMYEILKQYQAMGYRILAVEDLKALLGIEKDEYPRFGDFKTYVLNACQQALKEHTDIKFTYELHGKRGVGGKILNLKFNIEHNDDYTDQMTLGMFIDEHKTLVCGADMNIQMIDTMLDSVVDEDMPPTYRNRIQFLMEACNSEFSFNEVVILNDKLKEYLSYTEFADDITCYDYLSSRYKAMLRQADKRPIQNRFAYVKSLIGKSI